MIFFFVIKIIWHTLC